MEASRLGAQLSRERERAIRGDKTLNLGPETNGYFHVCKYVKIRILLQWVSAHSAGLPIKEVL